MLTFISSSFNALVLQFGSIGAYATLIFVSILVVLLLSDLALSWQLRGLPQPPRYPILGHVPYLLKEPWKRFYDYSKSFGAVYAIRIFNKPMIVISDPALAQTIFRERASNYLKDQWSYNLFRDVLGWGLVTSEGSTWRKHHGMLKPAFQFQALEHLHNVFDAAAQRLCDKIEAAIERRCPDAEALLALTPSAAAASASSPSASTSASASKSASAPPPSGSGGTGVGSTVTSAGDGARALVELSSTFRGVTLEVISEVTLGIRANEARVFPRLFESVLDELNERVLKPYRAYFPWVEVPFRRDVAKLNGIVLEAIRGRRAEHKRRDEASVKNGGGGGKESGQGSSNSSNNSSSSSSSSAATDSTSSNNPLSKSASSSSFIDADVAQASSVFSSGGDMLSLMLDIDLQLTDAQLSDEIKTQLLAGHETSSMMLTWAAYLLCKHPEAMAKAVAEVDEQLGLPTGIKTSTVPASSRPATGSTPTFKSFQGLAYLDNVLSESMRLFTPVPVLNREAQAADTLGGYRIPAKTCVMVSISSLHMDPNLWGPDVEAFRPERFDRDSPEVAKRHPWAFMPFSLGDRKCIGQRLALSEAKTVLGVLLRNYTLELAPCHQGMQGHPTTDAFVIPLRPASTLSVVATRRV